MKTNSSFLIVAALGVSLAAATRVWRDFFPSRESVYTEGVKFVRKQWEKAG